MFPSGSLHRNLDPTDDTVSLIVNALSRLTQLELGLARGTSMNTFKSPLNLSSDCLGLIELRIHFKTTNIGGDILWLGP